ncbi:MAG: rod shape-determining protein MreC [Oscillospiraceae bacterium]
MNKFWGSRNFKILFCIFIILAAFFVKGLTTGGMSVMFSKITGFVMSPLQEISSSISGKTTDFFDKYINANDIYEENIKLKEEVAQLEKKLGDFEQIKNENVNLKNYLDIKELNPDYVFEPATVIGRDPTDMYKSFTINKGSIQGLKPQDTVITSKGLVGIISEVSLTSSKVMTVLDVAIEVGGVNTRTREVGIVTGEASKAQGGKTVLKYIPRNSAIVKGDIILTTGIGGIFPQGLMIGRIDEIENESHGKSMFATIVPTENIEEVRDVFVIKSFLGQKSYVDEKTDKQAADLKEQSNVK